MDFACLSNTDLAPNMNNGTYECTFYDDNSVVRQADLQMH